MEGLVELATEEFVARFGGEKPSVSVFAPGRVNLIGEHTDYNEGFVLPFAIPMVTVIVGSRVLAAEDSDPAPLSTVYSCTVTNECPEARFAVTASLGRGGPDEPRWANYMRGVVHEYYGDIVAKLRAEAGADGSASHTNKRSSGSFDYSSLSIATPGAPAAGGAATAAAGPSPVVAFNAVVMSNVPLGSGLSSSAALE